MLITDIYTSITAGDDDIVLDAVIELYLATESNTSTVADWRLLQYSQLRAWAYPPLTVDADARAKINSGDPVLFVEGEAQLAQYYMDCSAVKARFPKPESAPGDLEQLRGKKKLIVNTIRKKTVEAGFVVGGIIYAFDANARIAYQELAMTFSMLPEFQTRWKASVEWVTMDVVLFQQIVAEGKFHIASWFGWQEDKEIELNACTTIEELQNVDLTPSQGA
jgi:hypothetical protein